MFKTHKGKFRPKNSNKYKGDPTNIIYRSGWERTVMSYLDRNSSVLEWSSEEIWIPYFSPWDKMKRRRRYFPDFYVKLRDKDGNIKECIMEVKPLEQTREPKKPERVTKRFLQEVHAWGINKSKWTAAKHWCESKGYEFQIITEKELGKYKNNGEVKVTKSRKAKTKTNKNKK